MLLHIESRVSPLIELESTEVDIISPGQQGIMNTKSSYDSGH